MLCPLLRRVERDIAATDNAPVQALLNQNREYTGPQQNAERAERAIAKALDDITGRVARGEKPCAQMQAAATQPPPAPALTLTPALTPASGGASVSSSELPK